jgi:hemerythrin
LEALVRETEKHFKHENAVMLEIYNDAKRLMPDEIYNDAKRLMPDEVKAMTDNAIKEHIAEHKQTLSRLQTITRAASPNTADTASSLCMELQQWFIEHAVKYDSHLKAIFQAM